MNHASIRFDVQGLRGIAVLAVLVFHLNPSILPGGYVGVDVFFVISGFLLTGILLTEKENSGLNAKLFLNFYAARIRRIAPAYYIMVLFVALVGAIIFLRSDFDTFLESFISASLFRSNQFFASYGDYFAPENHEQPLLHTWSLAVELQFYLLVPFLILVPSRRLLPWILVAIFVLFTLVAEYRIKFLGYEQFTYYSLYARVPEFIAGCLAALYPASHLVGKGLSRLLSGGGVVLILAAALAQPILGPFPGVAALLPIFGAVLILVATPRGGGILSSTPLVWVGGLSYSLYLWHWPVLAFQRYVIGSETLGLVATICFLVITVVCSLVSFYAVEQPFRAAKRARNVVAGYVLLFGAAAVSATTFASLNDVLAPTSLPVEQRRYADRKNICHGKIVGDCIRGDRAGLHEVLVLGDSHAAMLNHFFDELGRHLEVKAKVITASNCMTIPGFDFVRLAKWAKKRCSSQIAFVRNTLPHTYNIILAGNWSGHIKREGFLDAFEQFLIDQSQKSVFILSQVPRLTANISRLRRFESIGYAVSTGVDSSYVDANRKIENLAAKHANVHYISLDHLELFENAPYWKQQLIYFDEHHLNELGAQLYAQASVAHFASDVIEHSSRSGGLTAEQREVSARRPSFEPVNQKGENIDSLH